MRITCPRCQFKGLIDTAPLALETRVTCVRCGTIFDAVLVEGTVQISLSPDDNENPLAQAIALNIKTTAVAHPVTEAVPAQSTDASDQLNEPASVLEDLSPSSFAGAAPTAQEKALANRTEETAAAPVAATKEAEAQSSCAPQSPEIAATGNEPNSNFDEAATLFSAYYDRSSGGMRLMRISPLWLLVCGLTFVSVIVLSNQFAKPAEQRQSLAANFPAPSNTATNQALSQPLATAPMNSATTSVQEVSQPPAPAPLEVKNETTVVGEKAETQDEPQPDAPPSSAPVVETKSEPVIPAPQGDSQKADGLTIQVGSYNVIEQANERAARLQSAGFDARVAAVELPKRGMWYRVYAGRFDSRQEAARYGNELRAKGAADNFIITEIQSGK